MTYEICQRKFGRVKGAIFLGCSKKEHTSPTEEISTVHGGRGESYKECLEFVQDVHKREGGIVNFLHGGYGYFLEQPILWKRKKKLLSRYKIPCIF